jgi:hypothetical protein
LFLTTASGINAKKCLTLCLLAASILYRVYQNVADWPLEFAKAYINDSIQERIWVEHDLAKDFVAGVLTAFDDELYEMDTNEDEEGESIN